MSQQGGDTPLSYQRLFEFALSTYIEPEIDRRRDCGELPGSFQLRAAQVLFRSDGSPPAVRVNEEASFLTKVRLKDGVTVEPGEPVDPDDVLGVSQLELMDQDADSGHITIARLQGHWLISFDFLYEDRLPARLLAAAKQFYEAATFCLNQGYHRAFIDNLFSSTELTAKAALIGVPGVDKSKVRSLSHKGVHAAFNRRFGLVEGKTHYTDSFNKLAKLRIEARYLKRSVFLDAGEGEQLLNSVSDLRTEIEERWGPMAVYPFRSSAEE